MRSFDSAKSNTVNSMGYDDKFTFTFTEAVLYLALIVNLAYSLFYSVYSALYDYFTYIIFAFIVLLLVCGYKVKLRVQNIVKLIAFLALTTIIILINNSGLGLLNLIVWPIVIIYMIKNSNLSYNYINKLNVIFLVGWIFSIIASLSYSESYFEHFEMNYTGFNPNTVAIIIVFTCLFLILYVDNTSKSTFLKAIVYIISALALYRCKSRTSIIAFLAVILIEVFLKKLIIKSKKMAVIIMAAIIAAGIIFPFVYVTLFTKGIISYDTRILGKSIYTGRQYVWLNLWEYLQNNKEAYIWGTGYNETFYTGSFNLHNAYLMIFAQYGIFVLVIYLFYLFRSVLDMFGQINYISDVQFKCYQIILYVLIVGFGETILSYAPNMIFIATAIGIGCRERAEKY